MKEDYELTTVAPDFSQGQMFPRAGVEFDRYTLYTLDAVSSVKLHPRDDGTIHPEDIKAYKQTMRDSWKCAQGGILYCIGNQREFWNMVLNYHSSSATTGIKAWDRLFDTLRASGYDKGVVPCMVSSRVKISDCIDCNNACMLSQFYGTPVGCLVPDCPFLHDKETFTGERERILARRRVKLGRPVMRDIAAREKIAIREHQSSQRQVVPHADSSLAVSRLSVDDDDEDDDEVDVDPEVRQIFEESANIRKICNNTACLNVKMKKGTGNTEDVKMLRCSRCTVATYCSVSGLVCLQTTYDDMPFW